MNDEARTWYAEVLSKHPLDALNSTLNLYRTELRASEGLPMATIFVRSRLDLIEAEYKRRNLELPADDYAH